MIKMEVIGHIGRDCEIKVINGKTVINFSVAHTEKRLSSTGEKMEFVTWVDCGYWTERTGIAPYLKKGTQVYVDGQPSVRAYKDKEGREKASMVLRVKEVQLLGGQKQESAPTYSAPPSMANNPAGATSQEPIVEDDLPF